MDNTSKDSREPNIGVGISGGQTNVDGDVVGGNKIVYSAPVPVIKALFQLPPPPADFTGREAELRDLRAAIEKGGVHISGLHGQGGVGKTALALKLAAELASNYPDAQIYLDLKGVSEKPLTAAEAMSHILRTFHPEAKLPEKEDELCALYRSVLNNKRALLLMDNAKDAAQVKQLIPPHGSALLVTSRIHFTLPGLHPKNLNTLPPPDAKTLLLSIAPRIKDEAETIAQLCGYLPQALRLAATAIAERVDLSPIKYREKLADEKHRLELLGTDNEGVEASITLSYNLLDPEMQLRWRKLGVFPDTFDTPAAAAVWESEVNPAQNALSDLLKLSMLEWNESTERYRLHDLMRAFAGKTVTSCEATMAATRHARFYASAIKSDSELVRKGGISLMNALAHFDLERGNIRAGQAWAANNATRDHEAAKLCSEYARGEPALYLSQLPRELFRWSEEALDAAKSLGDQAAQADHLGTLGFAYNILGDHHRAVTLHEQQLAIVRKTKNRRGEEKALLFLGNAHLSLNDSSNAIQCYECLLSIARDNNDQRAEAMALISLGAVHNSISEYKSAIAYLERGVAIARSTDDLINEGVALNHLGNAQESLGNLSAALEYYKQDFAISQKTYGQRAAGIALWNMGVVLNRLGNTNEAIKHADEAAKIFEEIEHPKVAMVKKALERWRKQNN